jgi:hypothetical protein
MGLASLFPPYILRSAAVGNALRGVPRSGNPVSNGTSWNATEGVPYRNSSSNDERSFNYLASAALASASLSFSMSAGLSFGRSTLIVSLLSLAVRGNGGV